MNKISFIVNFKNNLAQSVSAFISGRSYQLNAGHANFKQVCAELDKNVHDVSRIKSLFDVATAVVEYSKGNVEIKNGVVSYKGEAINGLITDRILAFMREGLPYQPLLKFLENVMQNPSARARTETYRFLDSLNNSANGTPQITITSDGCFLAYKGVSDDYYSITSGSAKLIKGKSRNGNIYNGLGEKIEMERARVDDDCNRTCSYGLHVGAHAYASSFAGSNGHLMLVKVNPKDIVSIPTDCSAQKCRTCAYEVVDELENNPYTNDYDDYNEAGEPTRLKRDANGRFCKQ